MRLIFYKCFFCLLLTLCILNKYSYKAIANEGERNSARFKKLANQLRCPTCQGLSIKDSEAGFSNIIKGKIIELIRNGKSDEEILNFFVKRYGEWILRTPIKEGFNLLIWIIPGVGIFIGLFWVFLRFKISKNNNKETKIKQLTPEEEKKVAKDLKVFEND
tara:strand:+ start:1518 stop:2000 length:483 start_codon:yes stop_codon:yes gene_type:complete